MRGTWTHRSDQGYLGPIKILGAVSDDEGGRDSNLVMPTQPRVPSAPGQLLSAYTVTHSPTTFSFLVFFYL